MVMDAEDDLDDDEVKVQLPSEDSNQIDLIKPKNNGPSPFFHSLITGLINPLIKSGLRGGGFGHGHGRFATRNVKDLRRDILQRYFTKWKNEVGNDIYPCFRLLIPFCDKERHMYGLKEKSLAKLIVKIIGISSTSEDAISLINYKIPIGNKLAGDFSERCYEVIQKREQISHFGTLSIDDVNEMLSDLSTKSKADEQLPIITKFYNSMNAEELKWLIRIILRQMHIGATEHTIFAAWHTDANTLYNFTSSLKRVCWELFDSKFRLPDEEHDIKPLNCFQPQLAAFPKASYEIVLKNMRNEPFWIEEKMDGERIQLHMTEGGKTFKFFSRRAKDYTYLYGSSLDDTGGSLTKHLNGCIDSRVKTLILDGEMVSWDPEEGKIEPFGYLKAAANAEKEDFGISHPLYRVFDVLYLNGKSLASQILKERRRVLKAILKNNPNHFEIHPYEEKSTAEDIQNRLKQVIAESSEGLVIKDPLSEYRVSERTDDWVKVKPEYMLEFGENLDVLVIGGYYGQGRRGQNLSSFLCGLRVDNEGTEHNPEGLPKFYSFCKVGGGFTSNEYATIRHLTDGNWNIWDPKHPPTEYMELAGSHNEREMPDVWIQPDKSVVLEVKAASSTASDMFRTNVTLRFPRFRRLRQDKDYKTSLSLKEFMELKTEVEFELKEKKLELEQHRRTPKRAKRQIDILDLEDDMVEFEQPSTRILEIESFYILTDSKERIRLEKIVIENGGNLVQNYNGENIHVIGNKNLPKVASLKRGGKATIVLPVWIEDCVFNKCVLPYEPRHLFNPSEDEFERSLEYVDSFGDSYARQMPDNEELQTIIKSITIQEEDDDVVTSFIDQDDSILNIRSFSLRGLVIYFDDVQEDYEMQMARNYVRFSRGTATESLDDPLLTHVIVGEHKTAQVFEIRRALSNKPRVPRVVSIKWIKDSWVEGTMLSEEEYTM
ncbi:ATP dependent DNA ligase domain-containing protein [Lipomyces japonicus]|uniref:ATP dependent DNA ligase domain-containing protein n=1 Tax=Lipomyces japonicus TaxID=56871 RepID=UPI0034CF34E3